VGATNTINHTNDCIRYIDKLASVGSNNSPGRLIISASAGVYGNTNYLFDDTEGGYGGEGVGLAGEQGVIQAGASTNSITYTNVNPDCGSLACHITTGTNITGYFCWGGHSTLGPNYALTGALHWSGNSSWYLIRTVESFNGRWVEPDMGNFMKWYSENAFGGTNYLNTPVGAVSYTDEPTVNGTADSVYFGLWQSGKTFAICAWISSGSPHLQAVGDPFVTK
jgi:hypothetical protein